MHGPTPYDTMHVEYFFVTTSELTMISIYPTIYHEFQCKADRCENTCCQLWTIDIDEPTAERYHTMTGPLGESLRQAITIDEEGSHFVFSKEQPMCPLLNEKGFASSARIRRRKAFARPVICTLAFIIH